MSTTIDRRLPRARLEIYEIISFRLTLNAKQSRNQMNRQNFSKWNVPRPSSRLSDNRPLSELLWRATCPVNTGHVDQGGQSSNFHSVIFIKVMNQNVNQLVITCHVQLKLKGTPNSEMDETIWIICIFIGRNRCKWNHSFFKTSITCSKIYIATICHLASILNFFNFRAFFFKWYVASKFA